VANHYEVHAEVGGPVPADSIEMIRHHLATLVGWRGAGHLSPAEDVRYRSLCNAEDKFLNRFPAHMPQPEHFERRPAALLSFFPIVSSSAPPALLSRSLPAEPGVTTASPQFRAGVGGAILRGST
jgi:hypothetical protein